MDFIIPRDITREFLLSYYSEELYMSYYLGLPIRKGLFRSPLRIDHVVTCSFFRSKVNGRLYFHDFGTGEVLDFVHVVMSRYHLSYHSALRRIASDFGLLSGSGDRTVYEDVVSFVSRSEPADIRVRIRDFSDKDLRYWLSYGISYDVLRLYSVYSCSHIFLDGSLFLVDRRLTFGYYGGSDDTREYWKIYCPGRDYGKFPLSNWSHLMVQGYDLLPSSGDIIIITKSMKDVMCLHMFGISAIAPLSESVFIPDELYNDLVLRFSLICLFYDNDHAGISSMRKIRRYHPSLRCLFLPRRYGVKDISDFYKLYGYSRVLSLIEEVRLSLCDSIK